MHGCRPVCSPHKIWINSWAKRILTRPERARKNLDDASCYSRAHLYFLRCLGRLGENVRTPVSENLPLLDYYFFFVVFFAVFFFGGFFLPGPLCGMSLLLSPGYRFCVTPIRNIKLATRGSERSPSNAGAVLR